MPLLARLILSALIVALLAEVATDPLLHVGDPLLVFSPSRGVTSGDVAAVLIGLVLLTFVWWKPRRD